jgi:hypothetical protein
MLSWDLQTPSGNHEKSMVSGIILNNDKLECTFVKGKSATFTGPNNVDYTKIYEDHEKELVEIDLGSLSTAPLSGSDTQKSTIENLFKSRSPWAVV